jgi:hypothetical protein
MASFLSRFSPRNLGRQFKAVGQLLGEGARTLTKGFGDFVAGSGQRIREALPFTGASLATPRTKAEEPRPLAPPQPTATGGVKYYDPTLGREISFATPSPTLEQIKQEQARQSLLYPTTNLQQPPQLPTTPKTRPISTAIPPQQPSLPLLPRLPAPPPPPQQPSLPLSPRLPAPPPPPASTAPARGGGITTRQGIVGAIASPIAGQGGVSRFLPQKEEEEITEEERDELMKQGRAFSEKQAREFGAMPGQVEQPISQQALPTQAQPIQEPSISTTMPSASIQSGRITIPSITDASGVIQFAAQEAASEFISKLSQPGIEFTPQDLDTAFQVKKQEALDQIQLNDPELYNSIVNPTPSVPDDTEIIDTLPPELKGKGADILSQTPTEILDGLFQQYGIDTLLKDMNSMRANIVSEIEAYDSIVKDIEDDPDFPKRLAERRKNKILGIRDKSVGLMQAQLQFLSDQYNQSLNLVKLGLGIFESQQDRARQELQDNRNQLKTLIDTGGLLGLSDTDLNSISTNTGYTLKQLKSIQSSIEGKQKQYSNIISQVDDAGNLTLIGVKPTGEIDVLGTAEGVGKKTDVITDEAGSISERVQELKEQGLNDSEIAIQIKSEFKITQSSAEKAVKEVAGEEKFIDKEYIKRLYGEALDDAVKEAGFRKAFQSRETERENFLNSIMNSVEAWREAGFTDKEILKELQK